MEERFEPVHFYSEKKAISLRNTRWTLKKEAALRTTLEKWKLVVPVKNKTTRIAKHLSSVEIFPNKPYTNITTKKPRLSHWHGTPYDTEVVEQDLLLRGGGKRKTQEETETNDTQATHSLYNVQTKL